MNAQTAQAAQPQTQPDPLQAIRDKFSRLSELQTQIAAAKRLYEEYDALVEELVPCFISKTDNGWDVKAQITVGNKVYRLHPSFFNPQKNRVVSKTWKSAAFPTLAIEG
jgi:hypothetical protein